MSTARTPLRTRMVWRVSLARCSPVHTLSLRDSRSAGYVALAASRRVQAEGLRASARDGVGALVGAAPSSHARAHPPPAAERRATRSLMSAARAVHTHGARGPRVERDRLLSPRARPLLPRSPAPVSRATRSPSSGATAVREHEALGPILVAASRKRSAEVAASRSAPRCDGDLGQLESARRCRTSARSRGPPRGRHVLEDPARGARRSSREACGTSCVDAARATS